MTTDPYLAGSIGIISIVLLFVFIAGTLSIIERRKQRAHEANMRFLRKQQFEAITGWRDHQPDADSVVRALYQEHRKGRMN